MLRNKFNVVTDGQWGSCGKGAICTALALKHRPDVISTTNMANAGHTAVYSDGRSFIAKALPSASILNKWVDDYNPTIAIGPTAAFNLKQMQKEVEICGVENNLVIHPRAGVITDEHQSLESGCSDSSTKHLASTMQGCGAFLADKVLRKKGLLLARDYDCLVRYTASSYNEKVAVLVNSGFSFPYLDQSKFTILHEGSQGFSLDISHGSHYPQCTSRSTTAMQNATDMGINHLNFGDVYLVIRPYPIRVGNVIEDGVEVGNSGGCYSDQHEITWADVARESGMPADIGQSLIQKELTTVTKRLRRVFTFSFEQLKAAVVPNGATKIALNFANYIDWSCSEMCDFGRLPRKVLEFIDRVEQAAQIPVTIVGTGPQTNHVCFI